MKISYIRGKGRGIQLKRWGPGAPPTARRDDGPRPAQAWTFSDRQSHPHLAGAPGAPPPPPSRTACVGKGGKVEGGWAAPHGVWVPVAPQREA